VLILDPDRELASHLAVALRRYREELRRARFAAPSGLEELEEMVLKRARAGQEGTTFAPSSNGVDDRSEPPLLLTKTEAARLLNVSPKTVTRRISAGDLRVVRIGNSPRIPRADVERLAASTEGMK
jgi:excisionase family DNA binding protein